MLRVFLLYLLLFTLPAEAKLSFAVWTPPGFKYSYLVPVREGETLEHAVGRYQAALNMNKDLRQNLMPRALNLKPGKITELGAEEDVPRAIIVANKFEDMQKSQEFVGYVAKPLKRQQIKPYVLPLAGAELGLSRAEAEEARRAIKNGFDLYMGIGGDDISPSLYGRQIDGARGDISLARDKAELNLLREFMEGKGFIFNICRADQMLGVANGCTLIQDIPTTFDTKIHADGYHKIQIDQEASEHLAAIFGREEEPKVRSLHHEALNNTDAKFKNSGNKRLRVVARSADGVVEAVELRNGRGLGVQFHPELMKDEVTNKFFAYVAKQAKAAFKKRAHGAGCAINYSQLANSSREQ